MIVGLTQADCVNEQCTKREQCVLYGEKAGSDFYPELKLYTGGAMEARTPACYGDLIIHCESRVDEG